jgi:hypothetical protein
MLEGGIAEVTQVSQSHEHSSSVSGEVASTVGLGRALSMLLRIDLSGRAAAAGSAQSGELWSEQRIHTPASLFIALRAQLGEKGFVTRESADGRPCPGDILEFSAGLKRNPLLETMSAMVDLLGIAEAFSDSAPRGKGKRPSEQQTMKRQMESFISTLTASDTLDLTTAPIQSGHRCVITLEKQYLNDPSMSDLVDGTFRVLGKVTRVIEEGEGAISLNRKSAMSRLSSSMVAELQSVFEGPDLKELSLPKIEWEVQGPVVQVLPIAIFA